MIAGPNMSEFQFIPKKSSRLLLKVSEFRDNNRLKKTILRSYKSAWPHKNPIYRLYLSVPFKLKLENLDHFLRETWLECCGHLSQFKR